MLRVLLQCDDAYFVKAFSNYASTYCKNIEFLCFTTPSKAIEYLSSPLLRLDAVLATPAVLEQATQPRMIRLLISEHTVFSNPEQIQINIYQSGSGILSDIRNAFSLFGRAVSSGAGDHTVQVIAAASVQGGSGKTTLGYALAVTAARSGHQALYLNLEPFPSLGQLYENTFERQMDDLLFELKSSRDLAPALLDTMVRSRDGVYVLPICSFAGNLLSMSRENLETLVQILKEKTDLEYLILDLPVGYHPLNLWAMEFATCILQVYSDDANGRERLLRAQEDVYFKNLSVQGSFLTVINKCRQKACEEDAAIRFPFSESLQQGKRVADVMERNPAFYKACKELLEKIG